MAREKKELLHELSNQLTVIRGSTELVRGRLMPFDPSARDIEYAIQSTDNAIALVKELRTEVCGNHRRPKWWARGRD